MTLSVQFATMIAMILSGLYLGISLDTFRRIVRFDKRKVILAYSFEISFWLMQAFILFFILFRVNGGELRFYIVAAALLGFAMYQAIFKRGYMRLLEKLIQWVTAIYRFIKRLIEIFIITPLRWMFLLIMKIVLGIGIALSSILLFILKIIFYPVKVIAKLVAKLLPQQVKKIFYNWEGLYSKIKNKCKQWVKRR